MRLQNVFTGRPAPFDRNPVAKSIGTFNWGMAPHALTTRNSYTVPTGKKFQAATMMAGILRVTVATTVGRFFVRNNVAPLSGGTGFANIASSWSNAIDGGRLNPMGGGPVSVAGDVYVLDSEDDSTGGTTDVICGLTGTEFDA